MIKQASKEDFSQLMQIWESSVKNTHHFLPEKDFEYYKSRLPVYLDALYLYIYTNKENRICGFLGVSDDKIEMLFIDNCFRGQGIGSLLLKFAVEELKIYKLDVNEQNVQALGFYTHSGFEIKGRSAYDAEGKNYPLLHLKTDPEKCR